MKYTSFTAGVVGKIFTVLLCIILGIVIGIGGLFGAGYLFAKKDGSVGKLADYSQGKLNFSEDIRALSIVDWVQEIIAVFSNFSNEPISKIEGALGTAFISNNLNSALGIDKEIIGASKIGDLGATISNNMTVKIMKEKFAINFPDMPVFDDEAFLDKPISEAFAGFDNYGISSYTKVEPTSHVILRKMCKPPLSEEAFYASSLTGTYADYCALFAEEDLSLSQLGGDKFTSIVNGTQIGELIEVTSDSAQILKSLQHTEIGGLDARMHTLTLADMFKPSDLTSGAFSLIAPDTVLDNIPKAMTDAIKDATIASLVNANIVLEPSWGTLPEINKAFVMNTTLDGLLNGLIGYAVGMNAFVLSVQSGTPDMALADAASGMISFGEVSVAQTHFSSLKDFVTYYTTLKPQFATLNLSVNVTVDIDETEDEIYLHTDYTVVDEETVLVTSYYVIPLFNLVGVPTYSLTFNGAVKLGVFGNVDDGLGGTVWGLRRNQSAYSYGTEGFERVP